MVEHFNCSLLQMLCSCVNDHAEWERYLPLVLFAYRTAVYASTGVTPFEMMFVCTPQQPPFPEPLLMMLYHTRIRYIPNWHSSLISWKHI